MTPNNLLPDNLPLVDIHLPEAIGIWPPAWGWWLLLLLILITLFSTILLWRKYQKKWRYRREALKLLKISLQNQQQEKVAHTLLSIVKRTAMTAYPEEKVNALFGKDWIQFLNSKTKKDYFNQELSDWIIEGRYANQKAPIKMLQRQCQLWVKRHV